MELEMSDIPWFPDSIPFVNYYSLSMLVMLAVAVIAGYGRKKKLG